MKNEIMVFENEEFGKVSTVIINDEPMFEIYSVGMALGQTKVAKGKMYPRKERIDKTLENAEISTVVHNGQQYINESQLYDFMFEAKTDKCKEFRKWVCEEVLPSIRKEGGYISNNATEEQVIKLVDKYSFRKIGQIIQDTNILLLESKIAEIYDANLKLKPKERDKFHQKMTKTEYKIHLKDFIRKSIENRKLSDNALDNTVEIAIRYRIIDKLDKELLTTTRKSTSKKISHLKKELNKVVIPDEKYVVVNYHGLSNNKLFETVNGEVKRTYQYNKWINNFPKEQVFNINYWKDVDFTRPIKLYIKFTIANKNIDVNNLCKSAIDEIFNRCYKIDDNIVKQTVCELDGYCEGYNNGKIKFYIQNI